MTQKERETLVDKLKPRLDLIKTAPDACLKGVTVDDALSIENSKLIFSQFDDNFIVPLVSPDGDGGGVCIEWDALCMTVANSDVFIWSPEEKENILELPRDLQLIVETIRDCVHT